MEHMGMFIYSNFISLLGLRVTGAKSAATALGPSETLDLGRGDPHGRSIEVS